MLNIYYGRENIDKEKFIFDHVKGKTVLLVPDQFTLQAERNAFAYLGVNGLIDVEALSPSRLGERILAEVGGEKSTYLDKYGRHMILTKILKEEKNELGVFKGMYGKSAFVELVNNLISEMKQYNTSVENLEEIINQMEGDSILKDKLQDICLIYERYEEAIDGTYIDTEDRLQHCINKIRESRWIKECTFWVYGFDYFTPKNLDLISELIAYGVDVNVVMTYAKGYRDDKVFAITGDIITKLQKLSEGINKNYRTMSINDECEKSTSKADEISFIEKEIFAIPSNQWQNQTEHIRLVQAANPYVEMETAATYILQLIREKGFRYRDIAVICNDLDVRGSIIERVFQQYGLKVFLDKKRGVLHHPIVRLNLYLLALATGKMDRETVIGFMKTGLVGIDEELIEMLENYAFKYKLRGSMWKRDFVKGQKDCTSQTFQAMNDARAHLMELIDEFVEPFKKAGTAGEKIAILYYYLKDNLHIEQKLEEYINKFNEKKDFEAALETAQIWKVIIGIFDQIVTVMGNEKISAKDLEDILKSGFDAIELGMLPATIDEIVVGTMQRTRTGAIKALVVVGANEGILPSNAIGDGILNDDEKQLLFKQRAEICKLDELRSEEEQIALYKMMAAPEQYLYMSCSVSDVEGKELKNSEIFNKLRKIFPKIKLQWDIVNEGKDLSLLMASGSGLPHLMGALRSHLENSSNQESDLADCWKAATVWYKLNDEMKAITMKRGLLFSVKSENLENKQTQELYKKEIEQPLTLSPSRLEKFGRCPFAHFINYGLRPEERRVFEIAGREMGDIYHLCLMRLSQHLTEYGVPITSEKSKWMQFTAEQCEHFVEDFIDREGSEYGEGILNIGGQEKYKASRMKKVCTEAAMIMVEHVQQGKIKGIFFEAEFGKSRGKTFPAIEVETNAGKVFIEGKIDRVDLLPNDYIKVIDYKSGNEKFNMSEAKNGWRLQLMMYLKASLGLGEKKPAGVFYFKVDEPLVNASEFQLEVLAGKVKQEVKKMFRLDGVLVDEPTVIENIAGEFSNASDIVPIKKNKDGIVQGSGKDKLLTEEQFSLFEEEVSAKIEELCKELVKGSTAISPGKTGEETACRYCQYQSICKFDSTFEGCEYRNVDR